MRGFEDYCWRDLLTHEMVTIYAAYHRERRVEPRSVLLIIHPHGGLASTTGDWAQAAARLVATARTLGLPVVHSVPPGASPDPSLRPQDGDVVVARTCDSAFFFSELEARLRSRRAEGLIVCGAPTSGAVRATVIEAKSYGHHAMVAEETVGDDSALLHKMALFDLAHKYADVMGVDELVQLLQAACAAKVT